MLLRDTSPTSSGCVLLHIHDSLCAGLLARAVLVTSSLDNSDSEKILLFAVEGHHCPPARLIRVHIHVFVNDHGHRVIPWQSHNVHGLAVVCRTLNRSESRRHRVHVSVHYGW